MYTIATTSCLSLPPQDLDDLLLFKEGKLQCAARPGHKNQGPSGRTRSLLLPCLWSVLPGGAPALLPLCQGPRGWQHTLRFHATAWSTSLSARSQIVLSHTLCNMTSRRPKYAPRGGSKKFSKSLLGSPSHSAESSASLVPGFPPPAMWCCVTGGRECQPSTTRKRKACSRWQWKHQLDSVGCFGIFLDDIIIIDLLL